MKRLHSVTAAIVFFAAIHIYETSKEAPVTVASNENNVVLQDTMPKKQKSYDSTRNRNRNWDSTRRGGRTGDTSSLGGRTGGRTTDSTQQ